MKKQLKQYRIEVSLRRPHIFGPDDTLFEARVIEAHTREEAITAAKLIAELVIRDNGYEGNFYRTLEVSEVL